MAIALFLLLLTTTNGQAPVAPYKFDDSVLLKLQPSWRPCYMQYGQPIDQLNDLLAYNVLRHSDPYCLCETWWPLNNPTQGLLRKGTQSAGEWKDAGDPEETCVSDASISECESFESNKGCEGKVWVGLAADNSEYGSGLRDTVLRCTKDVTDAKSDPKYPVQVYEVDSFDIGFRCNKDNIIQILNDRLELYRQNSQFYLQIPMSFANLSELAGVCDTRLFTEGFYLTVYFKCLEQLPDMTNNARHVNPIYRTKPSNWMAPDVNVSCYYLFGEPLPAFRLRHAPRIPTQSNKFCVCEDDQDLTVESHSKCPQYDSQTCNEKANSEAADDCKKGFDPTVSANCPFEAAVVGEGQYPPYEYCNPITGVLNFSQTHWIRLSCKNNQNRVTGWCPTKGWSEIIDEHFGDGCLYKSGNYGWVSHLAQQFYVCHVNNQHCSYPLL